MKKYFTLSILILAIVVLAVIMWMVLRKKDDTHHKPSKSSAKNDLVRYVMDNESTDGINCDRPRVFAECIVDYMVNTYGLKKATAIIKDPNYNASDADIAATAKCMIIAGCKQPTPPPQPDLYQCNNGSCDVCSGSAQCMSLSRCQASCKSPDRPKMYKCGGNGICRECLMGERDCFSDIDTCRASCSIKPKPKYYRCPEKGNLFCEECEKDERDCIYDDLNRCQKACSSIPTYSCDKGDCYQSGCDKKIDKNCYTDPNCDFKCRVSK